jgi:inorganic phosphate transporter, PiT family
LECCDNFCVTHTNTRAVGGVGAALKVAAVRWNVTTDVVFAWIVTLLATAVFAQC